MGLNQVINNLRENLAKTESERDALAAQVAVLHEKLGKALDIAEAGAANNWYAEGDDVCWINDELKIHANGIPDAQHLAAHDAEVAKVAIRYCLGEYSVLSNEEVESLSDSYAAQLRTKAGA